MNNAIERTGKLFGTNLQRYHALLTIEAALEQEESTSGVRAMEKLARALSLPSWGDTKNTRFTQGRSLEARVIWQDVKRFGIPDELVRHVFVATLSVARAKLALEVLSAAIRKPRPELLPEADQRAPFRPSKQELIGLVDQLECIVEDRPYSPSEDDEQPSMEAAAVN